VLIETIIMDVSLSDGYSLGVSYLQQPQQVGNFTGRGALNNVGFLNEGSFGGLTNAASALQGLSYFGRFGQDFDATVSAAASDSRVTVIQKPRIMTFHAKPASFFIGNAVPFVTSTSYYGGYGGYGGPSSQYQQLQVGIGLEVTPYINQDGLVVMEISQTIDEISGYTEIANVGRVPNTANRTLSAQVAVKDRETIILGGFIRTSNTKGKSGVPILKDIPLLGYLFNKTDQNSERKELIVLMRPTVLRTPELAAQETAIEKLRLPGISHAEAEDKRIEDRTAARMKREFDAQTKKDAREAKPE
jgi:general secretion pathway protein D